MTEQSHRNLRVYCLCGQKMQVTSDMYGRPAKCVACHQKWFIPEKQEVSEETQTLNLKDHPELLRLPGQFSRSLPENGNSPNPVQKYFKTTPQPITDINLEGCFKKKTLPPTASSEDPEGNAPSAAQSDNKLQSEMLPEMPVPQLVIRKTSKIPMESFEPLRLLFSYKEDLNRRRAALGDAATSSQAAPLDSWERALDRTQKRILAYLQQEQIATAKQIAVLEEEIVHLNIALRVGDTQLLSFLTQTDDLRRSRESLVRHNYNLLAWQELKDPYMAGGIANLALESFKEDTFEIYVPEPRFADANKPVYVSYGDELRDMFEMRAALERRQTEWRRMVATHDFSDVATQEGLAETEAALTRNMAAIRFCQQRMEHIVLDCDNDLKSLSKYKEDIYDRAAKKQLRDNTLEETLATIARAETDIVRTRSLARQALIANSPVEVPKASTTMMLRLQGTISKNVFNVDSTLFFVAATCIIVGLLMFTDSGASATDWLAVFPTCAAVGIAVFSIILDNRFRAPVVATLWLLLLGLLMLFIYQRTAMDAYLILLTEDGTIAMPIINIRAWLMVTGAAFAGAGTGFACANYHIKQMHLPMNTLMLVICCTFISGIAVAATHTVAPRVTALVIESERDTERLVENGMTGDSLTDRNLPNLALGTNSDPTHIIPGHTAANNSEPNEGEMEETGIPENAITLQMQGVVHGEGVEPLFRASIRYPDGRSQNVSLKLGDVILGDWTAKEYNPYTKKLTISNGERLLILEAGLQVAIATQSSETS